MATYDAATVVNKWKRNLSAASQTIKDGVSSTTKNPMQLAAAQKAKWVAGVQAAADNGSWEAGLRSVSLESWKNSVLTKGIQRMAAGVEGATEKQMNFFSQLLPYTARVSAEVQAMPKGTLEDGIARAEAAIRKMAAFKYQRKTS